MIDTVQVSVAISCFVETVLLCQLLVYWYVVSVVHKTTFSNSLIGFNLK